MRRYLNKTKENKALPTERGGKKKRGEKKKRRTKEKKKKKRGEK